MTAPAQLLEAKAPEESARASGLRYVTDQMPGIRRERSGAGFRYRYPTGDLVQDGEVLHRIKSLVIPPAWQEVWICPDPCGHLQATGRDQRWRKQSRYHPRWRETRDETKYARMIQFAQVLPRIRKRVQRDLALRGLPRNKVLATVVRLLEVSLIRVGNEEYARENDSFGLTTMRNRHVDVRGSTLRFHFHGKSGKWHDVDIEDARLAKVVRRCQDLPGQELFQFVTDEGQRQAINSEDVNQYLREISGEDFTAKDFRTWAGTVLAALALSQFEQFDSQTRAKKNLVQAIEAVAERLGNTPAVCRKCYIHPEVINAYLDGTLVKTLKQRAEQQLANRLHRLRPAEAAVLAFLQQRLAGEEHRLEQQLKASLKRRARRSRRQAVAT
ncbi:MAG TPA: DNA topoisomerase IB [Candidatus Limnocylindrales bacterium]|nr:DNA topoisomerase IB [Candidatus Limnocylindrales bacterium]